MSRVDKLTFDIIERYKRECAETKPPTNIEIEVRLRNLNRQSFVSLAEAMQRRAEPASASASPLEFSSTVNIISKNVLGEASRGGDVNSVKTLEVVKGRVRRVSALYQKIRIQNPVIVSDYLKYSVSLNSEIPTQDEPSSPTADVRLRARLSLAISKDWRLDLTAVKETTMSGLASNGREIIQRMFSPALSAESFLRELNYSIIDKYEGEIEYIGEPSNLSLASLRSATQSVFGMISPDHTREMEYQSSVYSMARHLVDEQKLPEFQKPTHRLKRLANQVISLTKNTYYMEVFPPLGMFVTEKADGERAFVCTAEPHRGLTIVTSGELIQLRSETQAAPAPAQFVWADSEDSAETLVDAELIRGDKPTLLVFDVMVVRGVNISHQPFRERVRSIDNAVAALGEAAGDTAVVLAKRFGELSGDNLETAIREKLEAKHSYGTDGLILTDSGKPYLETRSYKWKPLSHTTIDFLAVACPQSLLGVNPYAVVKSRRLYLLFVGIQHTTRERLGIGMIPQCAKLFPDAASDYYPVQFSPSADPLAYLYYHEGDEDISNKIVELSREMLSVGAGDSIPNWRFHRVRKDRGLEQRYYGNDFMVAEATYMNYIDVFAEEDLWSGPRNYFEKCVEDTYTAGNKYRRFVISTLLRDNFSKLNWIIDAAGGRAADIPMLERLENRNAVLIDSDSTAVAEAIRRKYSLATRRRAEAKPRRGGGLAQSRLESVDMSAVIAKTAPALTLHALVADLRTPCARLSSQLIQFGLREGCADGLICNFALHYLCDTSESLHNFIRFAATMLRIGGVFMFTVMDGRRVFDLLRDLPQTGAWRQAENSIDKYVIRRDFAGDKLAGYGQTISVKLPFASELKAEPLCNVDEVIAVATRAGFGLELRSSMDSHFDRFAQTNPKLSARLTPADRVYTSLHTYVTLRLLRRKAK